MSLTAPNPYASDADGMTEVSDTVPDVGLVEGDAMVRQERSKWQAAWFGFPIFLAVMSWAGNGIPILTDAAWLTITILCLIFLVGEFRAFSFRWGIGGLVVYGGSLIWLCYDYMAHWFAGGEYHERVFEEITAETLARATLAHAIYIPMMVLGLRLAFGGRVERVISKIPGPKSPRMWLLLSLTMVLVGLIPHTFFTRDGLIISLWNDIWAGRAGGGAAWTTGRTGNVNFAYGAYLAQVIQVGTFGSILAGYYAILVARSVAGRVFGMFLYSIAFGQAFGTGARGIVMFVALPLVGFLFLRLQAEAAAAGRRVSLKAYGWLLAALLALLVVVQVQITFRNEGFKDAALDRVSMTKIEGNVMFSESLHGFNLIPKFMDSFYTRYPGESVVRPVWDTVYWFFVTPVPRAVWTTKPIDEVGIWYNKLVGGTKDGIEGTTISQGAVGTWYFRYGWSGVIQGGLIVGFVLGVGERMLRFYGHRSLTIIIALGIATWQFRGFRGWNFIDFHPLLVGILGLAAIYLVLRALFGDDPAEPDPV